jgi:exonuclease 1
MGISGLLPKLRSITTRCHVRELAGQKVAVDGYCWMHRAAYSCAMEIATGRPTEKFVFLHPDLVSRFVSFCMERVQMLLHHGVQPVIVFDGDCLPAKKGTETERKESF